MMGMTLKTYVASVKTVARAAGGNPDEVEIIISSERVDRDGEVVEQSGGDWSGWLKTGGSVLFAHDHRSLPVAKGLRVWIDAVGQTHALFRWVIGDEFASRVRNIFQQGLLAASIGFIPDESVPLSGGKRRYTKWRGLEFSLTPVPSNVDAIAVTRAWGLPVAPEQDIVLQIEESRDDAIVLELLPSPETFAVSPAAVQAATRLFMERALAEFKTQLRAEMRAQIQIAVKGRANVDNCRLLRPDGRFIA